MKRILICLVVLVLMSACFCASLAEEAMDFTGYTLEELLEIRAQLADEIAKRPGGEKTILGAGQYKIGEDLPAGIYTFKFVQNSNEDVSRTDYYVYENESMYKYDIDRLWLGDMPRVEESFKGGGETRLSLYPGEYLSLRYNGAEIMRIGNVAQNAFDYTPPTGIVIPKGEYTVGKEIPAGTYSIFFSGTTTSRVRVFQDFDESDNSFNKGKETILDATNPEGAIVLEEDNILRVEYTPIIMIKSSGFSFD